MYHPFQIVNRAAGTTNITGTYSELTASLSNECSYIILAFSASANLILGIGASVASDHCVIAGGASTSGVLNIKIPAGARLWVKTLGGSTISSGNFGFTFCG